MTLKEKISSDDMLVSTFLKTPSYILIEVLAKARFDCLTLDAEHAPFDRASLDACLAIGVAKDVPILVRIQELSATAILQALDSGATGIIIPHIDTVEKAQLAAKWARFGEYGRGYAGTTRWADYESVKMAEALEKSRRETVVIAQIEEPKGIEASGAIAAVDGIDALFFGPADVTVCIGETDLNAQPVRDHMKYVAEQAKKSDKRTFTFTPHTRFIPELTALGISGFFVGSEHNFMLAGAKDVVASAKP